MGIALLIPAALYILGIGYGNPRPEYSPSTKQSAWFNPETVYHPDESAFVGLAYRMLLNREWNPHLFHNPTLNIYTNLGMFWAIGAVDWPHNLDYGGSRDRAVYALCDRTVFIGAVHAADGNADLCNRAHCVWPTGGIRGGGGRALAVDGPARAYAAPNAETTMLSTAALMMSAIILKERYPPGLPAWTVYGISGLLVGHTMAARYNAAVVGMIAGLAMCTAWWHHRQWLPPIVGGIMMPVGFALGTPGILFATHEVIDQIREILTWYREWGGGSGFTAEKGLPSIIIHWRYAVIMAVGPVTTLAAVAGLGLSLRKWRSQEWQDAWIGGVLALYMGVYTALALPGIRLQSNLLFPLAVPLALLAGYAVAWLWAWRNHARGWIAASLIVLLAWPIVVSVLFAYRVDTIDNRMLAQEWIYAHIPCGTRIHLLGAYNVPLDPLDYQVKQTVSHQVLPNQIREATVPILVYSDAGPFVTLRDKSLSENVFVALEEGVREVLDHEWIELARFDGCPGLGRICRRMA